MTDLERKMRDVLAAQEARRAHFAQLKEDRRARFERHTAHKTAFLTHVLNPAIQMIEAVLPTGFAVTLQRQENSDEILAIVKPRGTFTPRVEAKFLLQIRQSQHSQDRFVLTTTVWSVKVQALSGDLSGFTADGFAGSILDAWRDHIKKMT